MTISLPNKPAGSQIDYWNLRTRFTIACIGRQWGKSTMAANRAVCQLLSRPDKIAWWVSPIVSQAKVQFRRRIKDYKSIIKRINKSDLEIELFNNSIWQFKGADDPENLKGETLDHATLDECGKLRPEVWPEVIRPMLAVKNGTADLVGTPKGKNWFYDYWNIANSDPMWSKYHAMSIDSPFFNKDEWESIKSQTPERIFRQEYQAEFIDDAGEVFHGFRECIQGELEKPVQGRKYVMGVDLAKYNDWTVLTVWDVMRKHLVAYERFNQIDWAIQEEKIVNLANKYQSQVIVDATGAGDPIFERLRRRGLEIQAVKFTSAVKEHLIESLIFAIEKREITFPAIPELIHELSIFNIERTPAGSIRYTAPSGQHDDIVISMALAVDRLTRRQFEPRFIKFD